MNDPWCRPGPAGAQPRGLTPRSPGGFCLYLLNNRPLPFHREGPWGVGGGLGARVSPCRPQEVFFPSRIT